LDVNNGLTTLDQVENNLKEACQCYRFGTKM